MLTGSPHLQVPPPLLAGEACFVPSCRGSRSILDGQRALYDCGHNQTRREYDERVSATLKGTSPKAANPATSNSIGSLRNSWQPSGVLVRLSDVEAQPVSWLWAARMPLGKLTVLDGDPGNGKSSLTLDLVARRSVGAAMPDGSISDVDGPSTSIVLSMEDGLGDTIRPRLEAAGADLRRVVALTYVLEQPKQEGDEPQRRLPSLPRDVDVLRAAIVENDARLVVIDPLMAYLTSDAHKDQEVRQGLAPLADLAEETDCAIVIVRHFNKAGGGNALYRGGGSIGIIGAARSAMLVAKDPDDPTGGRRILAPAKCNLAEMPTALAYHLETADNGSVRVVWEGVSSHTAAALLAMPMDEGERGAMSSAEDVLRQILADGPKPAKQIHVDARAAGVSERTLWRAKATIGVLAEKDGFSGGWSWRLPGEGCQAKAANTGEAWQPSSYQEGSAPETAEGCQSATETTIRQPSATCSACARPSVRTWRDGTPTCERHYPKGAA